MLSEYVQEVCPAVLILCTVFIATIMRNSGIVVLCVLEPVLWSYMCLLLRAEESVLLCIVRDFVL